MIAIKLFDQGSGRPLGYLKTFDPDAGDGVVTGDATATADVDEAMKFASVGAAISFAMQQSTRVPLRPDGEPNRPLTAFTLEFAAVDPSSR